LTPNTLYAYHVTAGGDGGMSGQSLTRIFHTPIFEG
jgi:hypothetical protein